MGRNIKNENIILAWNECYSNQDVDGAQSFMSDNFFRVSDATRWLPVGKERWGHGQRPFFKAFPNWSWELIDIKSNEEFVICEFLEQGTWTEPFTCHSGKTLPAHVPSFTLEPNNEFYTDYNCDWFRINDDGLIIELNAFVTNTLDRMFELEGSIGRHIAKYS